MSAKTTRNRIIEAADKLFYEQGFEKTSFADIADTVKISRGNFYYHFKTKDDILSAVIQQRLSDRQNWLKQWEDQVEDPAERILCFVKILLRNRVNIMAFGCPLGTLSAELAKLDHASQDEYREIFTLFRDWLKKQFFDLGHEADADRLAMHILSHSQGVATMANTFKDEKFIEDEVAQITLWLQTYSRDPLTLSD
ncbi:TetR/AcrR family transcriptional regulator [Flexibacterium corallicola]|uniref:TetR/AcrR family transcriptional regulator n=1 Tax=Flexibacterium corallicola TaxID=3037259 RepID=UPI00286EB5A7|nr:TetR/AcrR family transcriptional regulator [Pseudovibrio sp. M1P-2-3]